MFKNKSDKKAYCDKYYQNNKEELRKQHQLYYQTHKEKYRAGYRKWAKNNPNKVKDRAKKYRDKNKDKINKRRRENYYKYIENQKKYRTNLKLKVFIHYCNGQPYCQCPKCNETNVKFLTLDHINGGGNEQRRKLGSSTAIYKWIIENNFPEGYQVLCANCNFGKRMYGVCPHNDSNTKIEK
jgi:hypothetical protein